MQKDKLGINFPFLTDDHTGLNEKFDQFLFNLRNLLNNHYPQIKYTRRDRNWEVHLGLIHEF